MRKGAALHEILSDGSLINDSTMRSMCQSGHSLSFALRKVKHTMEYLLQKDSEKYFKRKSE